MWDTFKVIIIGNPAVGKTSLLIRYTDDKFEEEPSETTEVDNRLKQVTINGQELKLIYWDTCGQERFRTLTSSYYRGASAIVFVFSVTDEMSYEDIPEWIQSSVTYSRSSVSSDSQDEILKILIGNKIDVSESKRKISTSKAKKLADDHHMLYFETSAKDGTNVDECFKKVAELIYEQQKRLEEADRKKKGEKAPRKKDDGKLDLKADAPTTGKRRLCELF